MLHSVAQKSENQMMLSQDCITDVGKLKISCCQWFWQCE